MASRDLYNAFRVINSMFRKTDFNFNENYTEYHFKRITSLNDVTAGA